MEWFLRYLSHPKKIPHPRESVRSMKLSRKQHLYLGKTTATYLKYGKALTISMKHETSDDVDVHGDDDDDDDDGTVCLGQTSGLQRNSLNIQKTV